MAKIHEAWVIESSFCESKSKSEAKTKHEEFTEALQEYWMLESHRLPFNPIDCTWDDVLKELKKAEDAAIASEHGDKKFLTSNRRKLTTMSKSIVPLLNALPDELCILHGGLAVVFHLAQQRELVRRSILDTFEDIPGIIAMAWSKSQSFPEHLRLHKSIDTLKETLFEAIPSLIEILTPGKFLARVTCLFRGFHVQDVLDCIQRKARGVEVVAKDLQDGLVVKIHEGVSALDDRCQKIDSNIVELRALISEQMIHSLASKNGMFEMLKDAVSVILCKEPQPQPQLEISHTWTPSVQSWSPEQFVKLLYMPRGQETRDLSFVLRQSRDFDLNSQSYGASIISNPRFQSWAAASHTDLIYIEGHLDSSMFGRTSPISYFCANLVRLFEGSSGSRTLHFFCGQHTASNDQLQGPRGLMRSLLLQVLQHWPSVSLQGMDLTCHNDHKSISTEDLCQTFKLLLSQVPRDSNIWCIIDDLSQFEKERWDDDYWYFLQMLGTLTVGHDTNSRFKVLLTSSTKSKRLQDHMPEDLRIEMTDRDLFMGHSRQ